MYKILNKVKRNSESVTELLVPYKLLAIPLLLLCNDATVVPTEVLKTVKIRYCSADFMILLLRSISVNSLS